MCRLPRCGYPLLTRNCFSRSVRVEGVTATVLCPEAVPTIGPALRAIDVLGGHTAQLVKVAHSCPISTSLGANFCVLLFQCAALSWSSVGATKSGCQ
eukprot:2032605-Amphidinium_carterae.1